MNGTASSLKPRRPPLLGYVIAGFLGWVTLVALLIVLQPAFLEDGETPLQTVLFIVLGFGFGGSLNHALWGRRIRFGLRTMLLGVFVAALLCAAAIYWEYLPGTLHFDRHGFPHGSGVKSWSYDSGEMMLDTYFRAGVPARTTWYKPNGEVIATTNWKKDEVNIGYFLYQDGSIKSKHESVYDPDLRMYVDAEDGNRIEYAPDGTIAHQYRNGEEITPREDGMVESVNSSE